MKTLLPSLPVPGVTPVTGADLSRRGFLRLGGSGLVASWFLKSPAAAWAARSAAVTTKNTAKNVIFVFLRGAPSQVDTWDLKEGAWTPPDFAPTSFGSGLRFPAGLMPNLANRLGDLSIVRSMKAAALVHGISENWLQIARNPASATGAVAPNMGSVAALELDKQRGPNDVLPAFLALNTPQSALSDEGYFPSTTAPFAAQASATGLTSLTHPDGSTIVNRWKTLQELDAALRNGQPLGKDAADAVDFYTQAKLLMDTPAVNDLFKFGTADSQRYGNSPFGNACLVAKQVLAGARGTRFVMISLTGWDMHSAIYDKAPNVAAGRVSLYSQAGQLDPGLASLIGDLKATPGKTAGKTLFDETLIVVAGEFGRTVGALGDAAGRDHFEIYSAVFAGGGVKGGQVIGATDAAGATIADSGVTGRTELRAEDLACTVYSALGIDWTTTRHDDPLGRGFEYVPNAGAGVYAPIDRLFG
ncbi:MAG: DUF1501 domain-containing protein [Acidobacteria bacterium]|nr:DUF1501 domain-containing protein [Acidobacteriota bacterium]